MNKKIIFFLIVLVGICAISHVSAEEITDSTTDDVIASDEADTISVDENIEEKTSEESQSLLANESNVAGNSSEDVNTTAPVVEKQKASLKASKLTVAHKKSTKWTIKLTDANGKAISGKKIALKVYTGKKYKTVHVTTNSKGVASYNTKSLSAGTHKITASFADDAYNCKAISSSVKVVKQTALKIKTFVKNDKEMSILIISVLNKKTKKPVNGVKLKLLIYTGKKYKTVTLKTKKFEGDKGVAGYATNQLKVGKHKVKITPVSIKYKGSKTATMKIKKSTLKYAGTTIKI